VCCSNNEYCYDSTAALVCPLEEVVEHSHSDLCYVSQKNLLCTLEEDYHIHDDGCFAIENGNLICTVEETEGHLHSDECYHTISTDLICQIEETEGHIHGEECYNIKIENICRLVETEGHKHTEQCKSIENILNCEIAEDENHTHNEECYTANEILICTLEETEPHTHTEQCTRQFKELVCEKEEIPAHTHSTECYQDNKELICGNEEIQPHTHNTECYQQIKTVICEKEEKADGHTHTERCYEEIKNLICTEKEIILHSHTAECYSENGELTCGLEEVKEHIHSENCTKFVQQEEKTLVCTIVEHTHTDECYPPETDDGRQLICIREEHIHTETCGDTCEIQEHLHTEDCYVVADIEKEEVNTEDIPPLDIDLYDISNGPVVIVQVGDKIFDEADAPTEPATEPTNPQKMMAFSTRVTPRSVNSLKDYAEQNNGEIGLTLTNADNTPINKDENGNYIIYTNKSYNLTLNVHLPYGILPGYYQYKLPDGVSVISGNGELTTREGTKLGTWQIDSDGLISLDLHEIADSHIDLTITAAMGIRFSETNENIYFDGDIIVQVKPPEEEFKPTEVIKWGQQGGGQLGDDASKIYWQIVIKGQKDSNIVGSFLTDSLNPYNDTAEHRYTESDMQNGLKIGFDDPNTGEWHSWIVRPGTPGVIWNETSWQYTMPETCQCGGHQPVALGDDGWVYYVNYSTTPDPSSENGKVSYANRATIDNTTVDGRVDFTHVSSTAKVVKEGSFTGDKGHGEYLWDVYVTIPAIKEGQKAVRSWYIHDKLFVKNSSGDIVGYLNNSASQATVTVSYGDDQNMPVRELQSALPGDLFSYENDWTDINNGAHYLRQIKLYCKCNCTRDNCHYWGENGCTNLVYNKNNVSFCKCWTETNDVTFKFNYESTLEENGNLFADFGGKNNIIHNEALLAMLNDDNNTGNSYSIIATDDAQLHIPGVFEKKLTNEYDKHSAVYTITVNEAKINLTKDGAPLVIHDEMTPTLAYINGSLIITTEDTDGKISTLTYDKDYTINYYGEGDKTNSKGETVHLLDITILNPQPVKYVLRYEADLIFPKDAVTGITYGNSAYIELWSSSITGASQEKVYSHFSSDAKIYTVTLTKRSAATNQALEGAVFGLYNEHGGLIATEETDDQGNIAFTTSVSKGIVLFDHTLYYIQEIKAPDGYVLDDTKYWFYFCKYNQYESGEECNFKPTLDVEKVLRIPKDNVFYGDIYNNTLGYELPETGGAGTQQYTAGGLFLILSAFALLFYRLKKCRKEDITSS